MAEAKSEELTRKPQRRRALTVNCACACVPPGSLAALGMTAAEAGRVKLWTRVGAEDRMRAERYFDAGEGAKAV
ncbi:MAG: hypothetical protein DMG37_01275 [Acidobacteria bacterium]|nr:MAG: hypothetical protein DMG37_01275 [Acidobacteriota bacterium]